MPALPAEVVEEKFAGRYLRRIGGRTESIVPWGPKAGAWRHTVAGGWQSFDPAIDLNEPGRIPLTCWPEEVRLLVARFPEDHWLLLMHANYGGTPFVQLLEGHPQLAWLVAQRRMKWPALRELMGRRRREIAFELGYPATELSVRVMARVRLGHATLNTLRALRSALADPVGARRLAYLPVLNEAVATLLASPALAARAAPAMLQQMAGLAEEDAFRMLERFERPVEARRAAGGVAEPERMASREVGPPPIAENEWIRAITTTGDLQAEGAAMRHCAGSYAQRVLRGDAYFYRMLAPERVTICVARTGAGWALEQARCARNGMPQRATLKLIERWVSGQKVECPAPKRVRRRRVDPAQLSFDFEAEVGLEEPF